MAKTTHEYDVVRDTDTCTETFQIRSRCAFLCVALSAAAAVTCGAGALYPRNSGEAALNALVGDLVRARADADELRAAGRRLIAHGGRENSGPEPPPPKRDARPMTTVRYSAALAAAADTAQKTYPWASHANGSFSSQKPLKIQMWSNHKTGTGYIRELTSCSKKRGNLRMIFGGEQHASNASKLPPDRYVVNIVRDPFDLVVSSYGYHMQCPEAWTKKPLTDITSDNEIGFVMRQMPQAGPLGHLMKTLGAAGLPHVLEKESYCQYLLRIDLTAGLLVESIRTMHREIPYMLESRAKVLGRRGSGESVCVEDLTLTEERYCRVWEGILQASGNVQSETLLRDVLSASIFATGKRHHSGGETIDRRAAARIVRRHDAGYLGNRLQNAADILRCARKPPLEGAIVAPQATAPEKEVSPSRAPAHVRFDARPGQSNQSRDD